MMSNKDTDCPTTATPWCSLSLVLVGGFSVSLGPSGPGLFSRWLEGSCLLSPVLVPSPHAFLLFFLALCFLFCRFNRIRWERERDIQICVMLCFEQMIIDMLLALILALRGGGLESCVSVCESCGDDDNTNVYDLCVICGSAMFRCWGADRLLCPFTVAGSVGSRTSCPCPVVFLCFSWFVLSCLKYVLARR